MGKIASPLPPAGLARLRGVWRRLPPACRPDAVPDSWVAYLNGGSPVGAVVTRWKRVKRMAALSLRPPQGRASPWRRLEETIRENAQAQKRAQGDAGSVAQHPLPEQIEADLYLDSKQAAKAKLGVRITKVIPSGAV